MRGAGGAGIPPPPSRRSRGEGGEGAGGAAGRSGSRSAPQGRRGAPPLGRRRAEALPTRRAEALPSGLGRCQGGGGGARAVGTCRIGGRGRGRWGDGWGVEVRWPPGCLGAPACLPQRRRGSPFCRRRPPARRCPLPPSLSPEVQTPPPRRRGAAPAPSLPHTRCAAAAAAAAARHATLHRADGKKEGLRGGWEGRGEGGTDDAQAWRGSPPTWHTPVHLGP